MMQLIKKLIPVPFITALMITGPLLATDIYYPKKGKITIKSGVARKSGSTVGKIKVTPLPSPGKTYKCKRISLKAFAWNGFQGGKVVTLGNCKQARARVVFQIIPRVVRIAKTQCKMKLKKRRAHQMFDVKFPGRVIISYCFLNMKPKRTKRGKKWKVNCAKDAIKRAPLVQVPVMVSCKP